VKAYIAEKRGNTFSAPQYGQCALTASLIGASFARRPFNLIDWDILLQESAAIVADEVRRIAADVRNNAAATVRIAGIGVRDKRKIRFMHAATLAM
jgi:hypothetical protein